MTKHLVTITLALSLTGCANFLQKTDDVVTSQYGNVKSVVNRVGEYQDTLNNDTQELTNENLEKSNEQAKANYDSLIKNVDVARQQALKFVNDLNVVVTTTVKVAQ